MRPDRSASARQICPLRTLAILAASLALVFPSSAVAALGDDAISVHVDQARMKSSLSVTQTENGAVHELRLASGTTVREYAAPSGAILAVTWQGPWLPDLHQLLGT